MEIGVWQLLMLTFLIACIHKLMNTLEIFIQGKESAVTLQGQFLQIWL